MSDTSLISSAHIDRLAELAVKTGLALKPGQDLMITAPIEALPLVRKITDYAYKSGACLVTPIFSDPEMVCHAIEMRSMLRSIRPLIGSMTVWGLLLIIIPPDLQL